jgi:hypothetical protein
MSLYYFPYETLLSMVILNSGHELNYKLLVSTQVAGFVPSTFSHVLDLFWFLTLWKDAKELQASLLT